MLAHQFHEGVAAARNSARLDNVARLLWRAHAEGAIADADAEAVAEAIQSRRAAFSRPAAGVALSQAAPASARRRPPRSPDRQASLERRRRCAMSGLMPGRLAARFTVAEIAALSVIAREVQKAGQCLLPLDAVAALAGVARTTVQNAVRLAERLGLVQRIERRRRGLPSFPNILRIVAAEWVTWLRHGRQGVGLKNLSATNNYFLSRGKSGGSDWRFETRSGSVLNRQQQNAKGGNRNDA